MTWWLVGWTLLAVLAVRALFGVAAGLFAIADAISGRRYYRPAADVKAANVVEREKGEPAGR